MIVSAPVPRVFRNSLLTLALVAACGTVTAQVVVTPPPAPKTKPAPAPAKRASVMVMPAGAIRIDSAKKPAAPPTWSPARAHTAGLRDSGNTAVNPALPAAFALKGFSLKFDNGDHKLRRIGVLGSGRFTELALADSNGDDPFTASASYTIFTGNGAGRIVTGQVVAEGGGKFEIPLRGNVPANATLVLSGFAFQREDGSDANLRNIGVWMDGERKVARVSLIDDQGFDFRGFEATIGAAFLNGVLPGAFEVMLATNVPRAVRGIRSAGKYRPYRVTVQYAWIPNSIVEQEAAMSGTDRQRRQRPPSRIDALQGFEVMFTNSDHHLLGLGVNPSGNGGVLFQDNNTDDPMQWTLAYVTLKPNLP
ncbi:MAG: hypothetical protein M3Y70_02425 [Pseudomonadota bacterium]|nr:hypothetical protein [Pseudomonadota bacterium]